MFRKVFLRNSVADQLVALTRARRFSASARRASAWERRTSSTMPPVRRVSWHLWSLTRVPGLGRV